MKTFLRLNVLAVVLLAASCALPVGGNNPGTLVPNYTGATGGLVVTFATTARPAGAGSFRALVDVDQLVVTLTSRDFPTVTVNGVRDGAGNLVAHADGLPVGTWRVRGDLFIAGKLAYSGEADTYVHRLTLANPANQLNLWVSEAGTVNVGFVEAVYVDTLDLAPLSPTIAYGQNFPLVATLGSASGFTPTNQGLVWHSSDATQVTVDSWGRVKGTREGATATITVSSVERPSLAASTVVTFGPAYLGDWKTTLFNGSFEVFRFTADGHFDDYTFGPANPNWVKHEHGTVVDHDDNFVTLLTTEQFQAASHGLVPVSFGAMSHFWSGGGDGTLTLDNGISGKSRSRMSSNRIFSRISYVDLAGLDVVAAAGQGGLTFTDQTPNPGDVFTFLGSVLPANATADQIVWYSDNPATATVSSTGVINVLDGGVAHITAMNLDGASQTITLTVTGYVQPAPTLELQWATSTSIHMIFNSNNADLTSPVFRLEKSDDSGATWAPLITTTSTSADATSLTPASSYQFRLVAVGDVGATKTWVDSHPTAPITGYTLTANELPQVRLDSAPYLQTHGMFYGMAYDSAAGSSQLTDPMTSFYQYFVLKAGGYTYIVYGYANDNSFSMWIEKFDDLGNDTGSGWQRDGARYLYAITETTRGLVLHGQADQTSTIYYDAAQHELANNDPMAGARRPQ